MGLAGFCHCCRRFVYVVVYLFVMLFLPLLLPIHLRLSQKPLWNQKANDIPDRSEEKKTEQLTLVRGAEFWGIRDYYAVL